MAKKVSKFEDLDCWIAARELVKEIYKISNEGKLAKDWDTRSQFRRAALSIMNNIAEGFARYHDKEFIRFLDFAQSSAAEVKSMLYVFEDVELLEKDKVDRLHKMTDKVRNLTLGLIRYLKNKNK